MYKEAWVTPYSVEELEDIWDEVPAIPEMGKKSNRKRALEGVLLAFFVAMAAVGCIATAKAIFLQDKQSSFLDGK